jgi:hypothetical protein
MVPRYMFTQDKNVLGQIVTKCANNGAVLNFDLCDPQKKVKSKTWVLCHASLLDIPKTATDFELLVLRRKGMDFYRASNSPSWGSAVECAVCKGCITANWL